MCGDEGRIVSGWRLWIGVQGRVTVSTALEISEKTEG
jgi:hypothetical protein